MEKNTNEEINASRRNFITGIGKATAGAAVITAVGSTLISPVEAAMSSETPWPYVKLDVKEVGEQSYEAWYQNYCTSAVVVGIITSLRKKVGEPWNSFPMDAFRFGHGGMVGWGTMCGTLTGAGIITSLVAGKKGERIYNDIIQWYSDTALPIFKPEHPKGSFKHTNRSDSPLCHVSVGKWMKKEGVKFFGPERKDRCARLAASVAQHTVTLLNQYHDGKYTPGPSNPVKSRGITGQTNCTECHPDEVPTPIK